MILRYSRCPTPSQPLCHRESHGLRSRVDAAATLTWHHRGRGLCGRGVSNA